MAAIPLAFGLAALALWSRSSTPGPPQLDATAGVPSEGRLLWLDGRATVSGARRLAATDSTGRVFLVDHRLGVREGAIPGDVASIVSAAPAEEDDGLLLVDGRGRIVRVAPDGSAVAEIPSPYVVASLGAAADGRIVLTRSVEGFPFVLDTAPEAPAVVVDASGRVVQRFGAAARPHQVLLSDLANAGHVRAIADRVFFAPFIRDEIVAFTADGDTLWTLVRGLPQATPEPRFLLENGQAVLDYFPVNLGIALGPDGRLYALSTADTTLTHSRLDVIDMDAGHLLETFELPTAFPTIVVTRRGRIHLPSSGALLARAEVSAGPALPAFSWPDLTGTRVARADLLDRVTLINVWASWCAPCRQEMPELVELWESLSESGLAFYAVNEDIRSGDARDWLRETGLAPPVLLAGGRAGATFNYPGLPYTMLVDGQGRIVTRWIGYGGPAQIDAIRTAARRQLGVHPQADSSRAQSRDGPEHDGHPPHAH